LNPDEVPFQIYETGSVKQFSLTLLWSVTDKYLYDTVSANDADVWVLKYFSSCHLLLY